MAELFSWAAAIGKHHPTAQRQQPTTTLHPTYKAMVEEAVLAQVETLASISGSAYTYLKRSHQQPSTGRIPDAWISNAAVCSTFTPMPTLAVRCPGKLPQGSTSRSSCPVMASIISLPTLNCSDSPPMAASNIRAASKVWVRLFGLGYDLSNPRAPLRVTNQRAARGDQESPTCSVPGVTLMQIDLDDNDDAYSAPPLPSGGLATGRWLWRRCPIQARHRDSIPATDQPQSGDYRQSFL